jgi:hypothetical protein
MITALEGAKTLVVMVTIALGSAMLFLLCVALFALALRRLYRHYTGTKMVTCPENGQQARVRLDARKAARTAVFGVPELHVTACSRWPGEQGCGQTCVEQLQHEQVEVR